MIRVRAAFGAALLCAGLLAVPAVAATPASATSTAPFFRNPLKLSIGHGQHAASCADPYVFKVARKAYTRWFLYCTSDALTATEKDANGNLVQHYVPTFRSTDLVHWHYTGDAFPTLPSWVTGSVWAPDVMHRGGRYLMYFTASDTNFSGGGSAIGVATAPTPTGPWTAKDQPVVPPTEAPDNNGKRWEFDPEVIYYRGTGYLYFGSFYGGNYVRRLTHHGLSSSAASEKMIGIANRYEGTFIVRHHGWFYFMGSATNCCNGPLTGYSVFAARSRSPRGPFVDRDGVSILRGRVGGTPVLAQNGNRWVGAGHNAVITDYSGQQWIIYHAVDRSDPYYAGNVGYTKRPALMDALDWHHGWPVTRGGRGPSATWQPGPAAQPNERTAYRPTFVPNPQPGRPIRSLSDDFRGRTLSSQWTWVREADPSTYDVRGGALHWKTQVADLHPESGTPLASVLTEPAPRRDYVVQTKISTTVPAEGCCHNFVQGGILIYGDDGNYVKLSVSSIWETRQTEFGKEVTPVRTGYPHYGNGVVGPVGAATYLRIVRSGDRYTAFTSLDGRHWDKGDTWTHSLGANAKIALVSMGAPEGDSDYTSTFRYVHVYRVLR